MVIFDLEFVLCELVLQKFKHFERFSRHSLAGIASDINGEKNPSVFVLKRHQISEMSKVNRPSRNFVASIIYMTL